jgi:heavy metal translocating P-type ATPase
MTSPAVPRYVTDNVPRCCDYCQLPLAGGRMANAEPVYCCLGCRLAAEITSQRGQPGAVQWTLVRLGLAIFLSLNVMMFTMALWSQDLYDARAQGTGPLAASLADLFRYLCLVLSLGVLMLLGGPLVENALVSSRRDAAAADLLICVGVAAAYVYSVVSVLRGAGHVYFEVGCAVLVMVTLGRWLEASAKLKTTEALDALTRLLPARVRTAGHGGHDEQVALDDLNVGDRLHVLAGERIATDGRIVAGHATIDQQLLTGESQPVEKLPGDRVLGGSLNLDGDLLIEVTAAARSGSLARLVELVRQARLGKGRYERLSDRVARWFLKLVIVVALVTFGVHAWIGNPAGGIMAALAVLLIACPCALGLATPMAVWTAFETATRHGVLFRNGEAIERLATIRAVCFDKTGTLTSGAPRITDFIVPSGADQDEALRRSARLARASTHVFSQAIIEYVDQRCAAICEPVDDVAPLPRVEAASGQGLSATLAVGEEPTRLGSLGWLRRAGFDVDVALARAIDDRMARGDSLCAIGWGGRVRGVFCICESLRPDARAVLDECRARGLSVAMLTGDHALRGLALSRELGVDVRAELLPEDKVAALAAARRQFGPVAMVGDGVNDAPALAAADVGIALGCGADVSRDSASVCLLGTDLASIPWSIDLAQRTVRTIHQNLVWAFLYNSLGIALAATGRLNPAWAALAMVVSSSLVLTNSVRLARRVADLPNSQNEAPRGTEIVSRVEAPIEPAMAGIGEG